MKITFYGTAAAEGFPAMFCQCDTCMRARAQGGRNLRTRSQALIDDSLLIDFGPDLLAHTIYSGLSLIPVTDVIITHSHPDHLLAQNIWSRSGEKSHIKDKKPLHIHCTESGLQLLAEVLGKYGIGEDIAVLHPVEPFRPFRAGSYTITPLKASHAPSTGPVVYLINDGEKTFFYCTDTGYFSEETENYIRSHNIKIDAIAIDCTAGLLPGWSGHHLGLDTDRIVLDGLKASGALRENAEIVLHHFSHNCKATYNELVPIAREFGYRVSYDGMVLKI